jgi:hypothetical protein
MPCKCNKLYIGLIIGLIVPMVTSWLIFYLSFGDTYSISEFSSKLIASQGFTKMLSLSVLPNLAFFMLAIKLDRLLAARGIVTATVLYAILVIILRFAL